MYHHFFSHKAGFVDEMFVYYDDSTARKRRLAHLEDRLHPGAQSDPGSP